jgi:glutathione S-transferase
VPILRDGETVVRDSWKIAEYLDSHYPDRPSLFGGAVGAGLSQTLNVWADRVLVPAMAQAIVADIHERVDPADREYFRTSMENAFKAKIEDLGAGRDQARERLMRTLEPLRAVLKRQPCFCGASPAYGDFIVLSAFQWARIMCPRELLAADDPLAAWRDRMLDLNGGFARNTPVA